MVACQPSSRPRSLAFVAVALALALPAQAAGQSAFPVKETGDSGVVSPKDITDVGGGKWASTIFGKHFIRGFDACTYHTTYDNAHTAFQQWQVAGCTPVQTPWVEFGFLASHGYAIYCPENAPNSWVRSLGGAVQNITTSSNISFNYVSGYNSDGPSPPAKFDYSGTSGGTDDNTWGYIGACSPAPWLHTGDGGAYCCGQGPIGWRDLRPGAALGAVRAVKGPALRTTRHTDRTLSRTREIDLRSRGRASYALRCPPGYKAGYRRHGIGWYTTEPPSRRDTARTTDRARPLGDRGLSVAVRTRGVPRGVVRLQISLGCTKDRIQN